jgi:hypothetical protein
MAEARYAYWEQVEIHCVLRLKYPFRKTCCLRKYSVHCKMEYSVYYGQYWSSFSSVLHSRLQRASFLYKHLRVQSFSKSFISYVKASVGASENYEESFPRHRPWRPRRGVRCWSIPYCLYSLLTVGGEVVSLTRRPRFTPRYIFGTHLY